MDEYELRRMVDGYIKEMCHFSQMQVFATSCYQSNYFQKQIDDRVNTLINYIKRYSVWQEEYHNNLHSVQKSQAVSEPQIPMSHILNETQTKEAQLQVFTPQELAYYDGTEGKPIYVAVNNVVYDLSAAPAWVGGLHNGLIAGQDLTAQFRGCHQGVMDRLLKYPQAGFLRSEDI